MPLFATYSELRGWGATEKAKGQLKEASLASSRKEKSVFLSHSAKDDDLIGGVVAVLEGHGGSVFVDHSDPTVPDGDLVAIAKHLRVVIGDCRKFVLLASPRSKDSKWIPWELGIGDGIHTANNVALFPSAETASEIEWAEREYLGVYRRIVWGNLQGRDKALWLVWDFRKNTAEPLTDWLKA